MTFYICDTLFKYTIYILFLEINVTSSQLDEAAVQSGVLEGFHDYLGQELREKCDQILPNPEQVVAKDCATAYINLKERYIAQESESANSS